MSSLEKVVAMAENELHFIKDNLKITEDVDSIQELTDQRFRNDGDIITSSSTLQEESSERYLNTISERTEVETLSDPMVFDVNVVPMKSEPDITEHTNTKSHNEDKLEKEAPVTCNIAQARKTTVKSPKDKPMQRKKLPGFSFGPPLPSSRGDKPIVPRVRHSPLVLKRDSTIAPLAKIQKPHIAACSSPKVTSVSSKSSSVGSNYKSGNSNLTRPNGPPIKSSIFISSSGNLRIANKNAQALNKASKPTDIIPACASLLEAARNAMKNTANLTISESCNHLQFKCCTTNGASDVPSKIQVYMADTCPAEKCYSEPTTIPANMPPVTCPKYKKRRVRHFSPNSSPDSSSDRSKTQGIRNAFMSLVRDKSWMRREPPDADKQYFDRRKQIISKCKIQTIPGVSIPSKLAHENVLVMDVTRNEDKLHSRSPDVKFDIPLISKSTTCKRPCRDRPLPIRPQNRRGKQPLPYASKSKTQFEVSQRPVKQTNSTKRVDKSSASLKRIDSRCGGRTDKAREKIFSSSKLRNQCCFEKRSNSVQINKCNKCVGGDMTDIGGAHLKYEPKTPLHSCDGVLNASSSARKPKSLKHGDNKENEFRCEPTGVELNICENHGLRSCLKKKTEEGMPEKIRSIMQADCSTTYEKDGKLDERIETLLKGAKIAIAKNATSCRAQQTTVPLTTTACSPIEAKRTVVDNYVQHQPMHKHSLHTLITAEIAPVQVPPSRACSICDSQDFIDNLLTQHDLTSTNNSLNNVPRLLDRMDVYPVQEYNRDSIVQVHDYDLRVSNAHRQTDKPCINAKDLQKVVDDLLNNSEGCKRNAPDRCPNVNCKDPKVRELCRFREGSNVRQSTTIRGREESTEEYSSFKMRDDCPNAHAPPTKPQESSKRSTDKDAFSTTTEKHRDHDDSLREQLSELMTPSIEAILRQRLADKREEKLVMRKVSSKRLQDVKDSKEQIEVLEKKKLEKLRNSPSVAFIEKTNFHECVCEKCQQLCRKPPELTPPPSPIPAPPETPVKKGGCCGKRKKKKTSDCQEECIAKMEERFAEANLHVEPTSTPTETSAPVQEVLYECGKDEVTRHSPCYKEVCKEQFGDRACNQEVETENIKNSMDEEGVNYIICRDNDGTCDKKCKTGTKYERSDGYRHPSDIRHDQYDIPNNLRIKVQQCSKRELNKPKPSQMRTAIQRSSIKTSKEPEPCSGFCPIGQCTKMRPSHTSNKASFNSRSTNATIRHCQVDPVNLNLISATTSNAVIASSDNYSLPTERTVSSHKVTVRPFKDDDVLSCLSFKKSGSDKSEKGPNKKKYSFSTSPIKSNIAKKFEIVHSAITSIGHSKPKLRQSCKESETREFDWKTLKYKTILKRHKSKEVISPSSSMSPLFATSSEGELERRCSCSVSAGEVHDCSKDSLSDYYSKDSVLKQNDSLHIAGHHRNIYSGNLVSYYVISSAQNPNATTSNKL